MPLTAYSLGKGFAMLPLLTFASGLLAGVVGVRLLKSVKTPEGVKTATAAIGGKARHGLDQAQTGLRQATVSGLTAIERSSASLRARLTPEPAVPAAEEAATQPVRRKARSAPRAKAVAAGEGAEVKPAKAKRRTKAKAAAPDTEAGS